MNNLINSFKNLRKLNKLDNEFRNVIFFSESNNYSFFVNGSFVGAASNTTSSQTCNLQIGKLAASTTYTESGPRFGDVHVYNAAVGGSVLRTNFDAIHKPYNTRLFGDSFTAGS